MKGSKYDVIVVGAGHAGCEAARASARMGLQTAMITMNRGAQSASVASQLVLELILTNSGRVRL